MMLEVRIVVIGNGPTRASGEPAMFYLFWMQVAQGMFTVKSG